tara:strand:+ start:369 stop:587 length:219 start_codon:yes stop_codon:yes gene_type:complete
MSSNYLDSYCCPQSEEQRCFAYESYCLDCRVYVTKCECGFCDGTSGWGFRRWDMWQKKKEIKQREKYQNEVK